jgi:hypothetical protein
MDSAPWSFVSSGWGTITIRTEALSPLKFRHYHYKTSGEVTDYFYVQVRHPWAKSKQWSQTTWIWNAVGGDESNVNNGFWQNNVSRRLVFLTTWNLHEFAYSQDHNHNKTKLATEPHNSGASGYLRGPNYKVRSTCCSAHQTWGPHTQYVYNRALYTYINIRTCTRTGSRCTHCAHGLATDLFNSSIWFEHKIHSPPPDLTQTGFLRHTTCETVIYRGTRWRSWLRHCATSQKVAGSIPDGVTGIFQWLNPSGRIVALGSTEPLTEMSTRSPSWG